jgi:transposase InsO family protein
MRIPVQFNTLKTQALIDTGAAASFLAHRLLIRIPYNDIKEIQVSDPHMQLFRTVSGEIVKPIGRYELNVRLARRHPFTHQFFVIADLDEGCILGYDFLAAHEIVISPSDRSISYKHENELRTLVIPPLPICSISMVRPPQFELEHVPEGSRENLKNLLMTNFFLFTENIDELGTAKSVKHAIRTTQLPNVMPMRRTPERLRLVVKKQIEDMLRNKIIRPSTSPYASPILLVAKKEEGQMRFCVDYRPLNSVTVKDRYPIPNIQLIIDSLHGSKFFSTLDLLSGYWQIEIEEKHKYKTAFICEYGLYEFNRMPFGLCNAPGTFQREMNNVLQDALYEFVLVYLDDIIVFSKTEDDHIRHLRTVFDLLAKEGLKLKLSKCDFFKTTIKYLGHIITAKGFHPDVGKIVSILNYPEPNNVKQLMSFLGLVNYYRKFVRKFAEKAHNLTELTKKTSKWEWGEKERDAFQCIKECLTSNPLLRYPDFTREFLVYADASGYGIGAVLAQVQNIPPNESDPTELHGEHEVVIAYTSRHLDKREQDYPISEKECLAIVHALEHFRPYLYGRTFKVFTDHQPLEALKKKKDPHGRLARWRYEMNEYDMNIIYRPGQENQNADALSRQPLPTLGAILMKPEVTQNSWIVAQNNDNYCKGIILELNQRNNKATQDFHFDNSGLLVTFDGKIVVPKEKIPDILKMNHDHMLAGHLGIAKSLARIKRQYHWPGLGNDVKSYVGNCITCAKRKAYGSNKAPLKPLPPVERVWEQIAMDIVGPVTESSNGNKYILVLSDYASRYVMTIPMKNQKAHTIAENLVKKVYTKFGPPQRVLTDRGTNFLSKLISSICLLFKIQQIKTTSYHPQTDGLVERFNRTLCDMLACYVNEKPESWDQYLDFVTFAYNTSQQTTINSCPFYLFFKRDPVIPNDISVNQDIPVFDDDDDDYERQWHTALELSRENLRKVQGKQKQLYDQGSKLIVYKINDHVLLKAHATTGKFSNRWIGPFIISRKVSDLNYEITKIADEAEAVTKFIVHVNRLKLVSERPNEIVFAETKAKVIKRRGRPRKGTNVDVIPKRKIGRPRLFKQNAVNIPKHRGRKPKKQQHQSDTIPNTSNSTTNVQTPIVVNHRYNLRRRN